MLTAENISFRYGEHKVVDGVSLALGDNEIVGVLGLNGAGKSTLLKLLLGLLVPEQGAVTLDDQPLTVLAPAERAKKIAAVLQNESLQFPYSAKDLVMLGRYAHRGRFAAPNARDEEIVAQALKTTDAEHLAQRQVNTLSGGEARRVLLARALAQEPKYLLLDEPTAGLDLPHQLDLAERFKRLGVGILWVLHDINLALSACDRVCVLQNGKLVFAGKIADAFSPQQLAEVFHVQGERVHDSAGKPHVVFRARSGDAHAL